MLAILSLFTSTGVLFLLPAGITVAAQRSQDAGSGSVAVPGGNTFTFEVLGDGTVDDIYRDVVISEKTGIEVLPSDISTSLNAMRKGQPGQNELKVPGFNDSISDVPIELNDLVVKYISFFQTRMKDRFEEWLARSGRYVPMMQEILRKQQVPEDLVFLALIESGFNSKAFSRAKAAGQWQFMQGTGKRYGLKIDQWVDERRDPVKSTVAAAKYLKDLHKIFGSWPLSMASYNAGEGKIMRALVRTNGDDLSDLRTSTYVKTETQHYVPKYMAATIIAKNPEKYGFFVNYHEPLRYDEVEVKKTTSLKAIARAASVTLQEIKLLNPELKREATPPYALNYPVRLPYGRKGVFLANFYPENKTKAGPKKTKVHRIAKGETVYSISRKYGIGLNKLLEANELISSTPIQAGHVLVIPSGKEKI